MLDKLVETTIATRVATHKTTSLETGIATSLSKVAYKRSYSGHLWMLEGVLELPDATMEEPFFDDQHSVTLASRQNTRACLLTIVGGLDLTSADEMRFAAGALPAAPLSFNDALGDSMWVKLIAIPILRRLGDVIRVR